MVAVGNSEELKGTYTLTYPGDVHDSKHLRDRRLSRGTPYTPPVATPSTLADGLVKRTWRPALEPWDTCLGNRCFIVTCR